MSGSKKESIKVRKKKVRKSVKAKTFKDDPHYDKK